MSVSPETVYFITLAITGYYMVKELSSFDKDRWIKFAIIAVILLALIYYFVIRKSSQVKTEFASEDLDQSVFDNEAPIVENNEHLAQPEQPETPAYMPRDKSHSRPRSSSIIEHDTSASASYELQLDDTIQIIDEPIHKSTTIKYVDFVKMYDNPEFLKQYVEALKIAYADKKERLRLCGRKLVDDLTVLKRSKESNPSPLTKMLDRDDNAKDCETAIAIVKELIAEITEKQKNVNVGIAKEMLKNAFFDKKDGICSLIGRDNVKDFLALQIYSFSRNPRIFFSNFQHMCIYGGSGIGKTKVAKVIGHVYANCGIIIRNHVMVTTKQHFLTAYVGETPKITKRLLMSNLESVVFIDEAYDLIPEETIMGRAYNHGSEAIVELVNFVDKMIGLNVIIAAGYANAMKTRFIASNEGMERRFPHIIELDPYTPKELTNILIHFLKDTCKGLELNSVHINKMFTYITKINTASPEAFSKQAGDISNLAGCIGRVIYGTPNKNWSANSNELLIDGINSYLKTKGIGMQT